MIKVPIYVFIFPWLFIFKCANLFYFKFILLFSIFNAKLLINKMLVSVSVSASRANIIKSIYKFIEIFFKLNKKICSSCEFNDKCRLPAYFVLQRHSASNSYISVYRKYISSCIQTHTLNTAQQQLYYASNSNTYNETRERIKTAVSCCSH